MGLRRRTSWALGIVTAVVAVAGVMIATTATGSAAPATVVCAPVPNPAVQTNWVPFGAAVWTANGLLTRSASNPSQPYGVSCGGASIYGTALPTTDATRITALSFDFNPNQTGSSGQAPRLIVCFSDGANCDSNGHTFPSQWTAGVWTHFDALSGSWGNVGGSCGSKDNLTFSQVTACHPGATVTQIAIVNDAGSLYGSGEQVLLNNLTVNNVTADAVPPVLGQNATVVPTLGTVRIKKPGARTFSTLHTIVRVGYGTSVDASSGQLQVIAAKGRGQYQSGVFYDGNFSVTQNKSGVVQAALTNRPTRCPTTPLSLAHDARSRSFKLWGHVKGNYRTRGHYGSASVQGTIWLTEERCTGTFFHVVQGVLRIRDFTLHKTVILRAGHSYLARSQRPDVFDHDGDYDNDKSQGLVHDRRR